MKIYNKITLGWNEATERYDDVLFEDSFQYGGEILALGPGDGTTCNCMVGAHWTNEWYGCGNPTWTCVEIGSTNDCPDGYPSDWPTPWPDDVLGQCTPPGGGEGGGTPCNDNIDCLEMGYSDDYFCIDGECQFQQPGCMDEGASNYNPNAQYDDGSCTYDPVLPDLPGSITVDDTQVTVLDATSTIDPDIDQTIADLTFTWMLDGPGVLHTFDGPNCTDCIARYGYYGVADYGCIGVDVIPEDAFEGDCDNTLPSGLTTEATIDIICQATDGFQTVITVTTDSDGVVDPMYAGFSGDQLCNNLDAVDPTTLPWQQQLLFGDTETVGITVIATDPGGLFDQVTTTITVNGTVGIVIPEVNYFDGLPELDTTESTSILYQPTSINNPTGLPITFYNVDDEEILTMGDEDDRPIIGSYSPFSTWMNSTDNFSDYIQVYNLETGDYDIEVLDSKFYGRLSFHIGWSIPVVGNLTDVGLPGTPDGICSTDPTQSCLMYAECPSGGSTDARWCLHRFQDRNDNWVVGDTRPKGARINIDYDSQGGHLYDHIIDGGKNAPQGQIQLDGQTGSELNLFINQYIIHLSENTFTSPLGYAVEDRDGNSTYEIEIELLEGIGVDRDAEPSIVLDLTPYNPAIGLDYTFEQNGKYEVRISASDVWDNPGVTKLNVMISGVVEQTPSVLDSYSPYQGIDLSLAAAGDDYSTVAPTTSRCIPDFPCNIDSPGDEASCTGFEFTYEAPASSTCEGDGVVYCDYFRGVTQDICLSPCTWTAVYGGLGDCSGGPFICDNANQTECGNLSSMSDGGCEWTTTPAEVLTYSDDFCQWVEIDCIDVEDDYPDDFTTLDALDADPRHRLGLYYWNEIQPNTADWASVIEQNESLLGKLSAPYNTGVMNINHSMSFIPDVDVRTTYGLEESQDAPLYRYYDRDLQFDQYESAVAPGTVQLSFYPRMGAYGLCPYGTGKVISVSPFSASKPLYRNPTPTVEGGMVMPGEIDRDKFLIVALDWGDGSDIEYNQIPLHPETDKATHTYKKSGIYQITGFMIKMVDGYDHDSPTGSSVKEFIKFELFISINKRIGFEDEFKLLGGDDYTYIPYSETTPVISGISEFSLYHKTIARAVGYIGESRLDIEFPSQGELAKAEYALANMNEDLSGYEEIDRYNDQVFDENNNNELIYGEQYPLRGELGDWVGNVDLAQARVFTRPLQMYEMLGFQDDESGTPYNDRYWQNIIPAEWDIYCNRVGVTCTDGSVVIEEGTQAWDDGTDQYYYPVMPILTQDGMWDIDNLQGNRIPFGTPDRDWDRDDDSAPITATDLQDESLILDLDFSKVKQKSLSDRSGAQNAGMLIGDYAIRYDEKRYAVGKKQSLEPVIRKKQQRKAY